MSSASLTCMRESLRYVQRPSSKISAFIFLLIANAVMPVAGSAFMRRSVDALYAQDGSSFGLYCLLLLLSYVGSAAAMGSAAMLRQGIAEGIAAEQRRAIIRASLAMPFQTYEKTSRGDTLSRLTADVDQASRIYTGIYLALNCVITASAAVAYMIYLNWQVGLATVASSLAVVWITRRSNDPLLAKTRSYQESLGGLSGTALNFIEGTTVIKSFLAEDTAAKSFAARTREVFAAAMAVAKSTANMRAATGAAVFLPLMTAFVFGGYMAVVGRASPGSVLGMIALTDSIAILVNLGPRWAEIQRSAGAYERVKAAISAEPDSVPARPAGSTQLSTSTPAAAPMPAILVENLSFEYEPGRPVLKDISFKAAPGSKVAIVGRSGCGKSTLLKLLAGLHAPPPGTVFVHGLDMCYERLEQGGQQITYVPQEPFLFSGTVRDNLLLGNQSATEDTLSEALDKADSDGFLKGMPDGLDSEVGERGSLVSGGQRQRLSLARGLLRGAPVLLLDEPTSALDRDSEARVVESILGMAGVTCVVVTHRPSLAAASDLILVMDSGRIVERGTHSELMENRSLYWSFYSGETTFSPVGTSEQKGETK